MRTIILSALLLFSINLSQAQNLNKLRHLAKLTIDDTTGLKEQGYVYDPTDSAWYNNETTGAIYFWPDGDLQYSYIDTMENVWFGRRNVLGRYINRYHLRPGWYTLQIDFEGDGKKQQADFCKVARKTMMFTSGFEKFEQMIVVLAKPENLLNYVDEDQISYELPEFEFADELDSNVE